VSGRKLFRPLQSVTKTPQTNRQSAVCEQLCQLLGVIQSFTIADQCSSVSTALVTCYLKKVHPLLSDNNFGKRGPIVKISNIFGSSTFTI